MVVSSRPGHGVEAVSGLVRLRPSQSGPCVAHRLTCDLSRSPSAGGVGRQTSSVGISSGLPTSRSDLPSDGVASANRCDQSKHPCRSSVEQSGTGVDHGGTRAGHPGTSLDMAAEQCGSGCPVQGVFRTPCGHTCTGVARGPARGVPPLPRPGARGPHHRNGLVARRHQGMRGRGAEHGRPR